MRAYMAFTRKELKEHLRSYKLFIMGAVFLLLGMMNPIMAKYTPALLETVAPEWGINMPEPTAMDSWVQFFSNLGQLGLIALVIVFSGIMAGELSQGTLVNMLTKGLKRGTVILSKLTAATLLWTFYYGLSLAVSYLYTVYFWGSDQMENAFWAFSGLWLFGVLLIVFVVLGGVLFRKMYGSLLFTGGLVVVMSLVNISPRLHKYNPITLASDNISLLTAQKAAADFIPAFAVCAICVVLLSAGCVAVFNKQQL